jgi:tetratricopeptide (TPR) repeat protein
MSIRGALVPAVVAACLIALSGCSSWKNLNDLDAKKADPPAAAAPAAPATGAGAETTGSIVTQPAESGKSLPPAPLAAPGLAGDDPNDDVVRGKRYFRANDFGLAEKSFRAAVEKHPRDAESWVGLAASYDRLHRFDLADRAYAEAIRLVGPTPEILNDEGFSYMLRGDYARAARTLQLARAKDPANPYIQANMQLLEESYHSGKAVK